MAQVDLYQYVEIIKSDGTKIRLGSKQKPSTITLTGTGTVHYHVYNDVSGASDLTVYSGDLVGLKFFAVRCSVEALFGFSGAVQAGTNNAIHLSPDVWQFFGEGTTTEDGDGILSIRINGSETTVTEMIVRIPGATAGDIEFVGAY